MATIRGAFAGRIGLSRRFGRLLIILLVGALLGLADAGTVLAGSKWGPHIDVHFKPGNKRTLGELDVFLPLWQDNRTMVFGNIRGQGDVASNGEGNFGIGYRRLISGEWIVGAYAYFDVRRTRYGNRFVQGTLGLEALSVDWDFRANGYIPEPGAKRVDALSMVEVSGSQIVIREGIERALAGFDGEIGRRLPVDGVELRVYAGGYYFHAKGVQTVAGPRGRVEARFNDLEFAGGGTRLTIGLEAQWDRPRGGQVFAVIALRIPLGGAAERARRRALSPLERRMTERVVRDVDIVSQEHHGGAEPALYDGRVISGIDTVDAGGDLKTTVEVASAANGIVVVKGAVNVPLPVTMKQGQIIFGGGSAIALTGARTGAVATFRAPGTAGAVTGGAAGIVLSAANNTVIAGLAFSGGAQQISAIGVTGVVIRGTNHTIANGTQTAIVATNVTGLAVDGVSISGPGALGTGISLSGVQGSITSTSIAGTQFGIAVAGTSSVALVGVNANNSAFGVFIWALGGGAAIDISIDASVMTGNGYAVVAIGSGGGTVALSGAGNTMSGSTTANCFIAGPVTGAVGGTPQNCPP